MGMAKPEISGKKSQKMTTWKQKSKH